MTGRKAVTTMADDQELPEDHNTPVQLQLAPDVPSADEQRSAQLAAHHAARQAAQAQS